MSSDDDEGNVDHQWLPELDLDRNDKEILETNGWLSDKHICAAQTLFKRQFPHMDGLQPPTLSQTGTWPIVTSEGVQILNENNNHWLCVSTVGCPANVINLYDSTKRKAAPTIIRQIATFIHCQASSFTICGIGCQKQSGSRDCGLYATATATQLCHGELPGSVVWDQMLMRSHLLECFEGGELVPFPGRRVDGEITENVAVKQVVPVYCTVHAQCLRTAKTKRLSVLSAKSGFTRSAKIFMQMCLEG